MQHALFALAEVQSTRRTMCRMQHPCGAGASISSERLPQIYIYIIVTDNALDMVQTQMGQLIS